jgi:cytochrome P450
MAASGYTRRSGNISRSSRILTSLILYAKPHAVTQDDYYQGYLIPKGAGVINNAYTISSNPYRYPDPRRFEPERYKDDHNTIAETATSSDVNVRDHFTFGAGRRICQGMHVAERSLFLGMSRLLWAFDFHPVPGKEPDPTLLTQGFLATPEKYEADIRPKEGRAAQIRSIWEEAQSVLDGEGQWLVLPDELKA